MRIISGTRPHDGTRGVGMIIWRTLGASALASALSAAANRWGQRGGAATVARAKDGGTDRPSENGSAKRLSGEPDSGGV